MKASTNERKLIFMFKGDYKCFLLKVWLNSGSQFYFIFFFWRGLLSITLGSWIGKPETQHETIYKYLNLFRSMLCTQLLTTANSPPFFSPNFSSCSSLPLTSNSATFPQTFPLLLPLSVICFLSLLLPSTNLKSLILDPSNACSSDTKCKPGTASHVYQSWKACPTSSSFLTVSPYDRCLILGCDR